MLDLKEIIRKNVHFILSHFKGQEYNFPRSIMTLKTKGQIYTENEEEIFQYFLESDFKDCKINGYPFYDKAANKLYPSFIFIDLDLSLCNTCKYPKRKLDYILKQTLNKLEKEVNGTPTVLWTGAGYHIYLPIHLCNLNDRETERYPLEFVTPFNEIMPYVNNDLTTEFMRFAAKYFTNNQNDYEHNNHSITSCLLLVPETINSKCNFKVKIIQEWDGKEANANTIASYFLEHYTKKV
ncbi:MAG: hypothetical protein ABJB76_08555 [Candidatus Nitrosocosmicus sp.]